MASNMKIRCQKENTRICNSLSYDIQGRGGKKHCSKYPPDYVRTVVLLQTMLEALDFQATLGQIDSNIWMTSLRALTIRQHILKMRNM